MKGLPSAAILVAGLSQLAPMAHAQSACQRVQFSAEVLQRLPRVREACLDVITRDGQEFAVIKADLLQVSRTSVTVRPKLPGGSRASSRTIAIDPGFRVLVDGQPRRVDELELGQELTAYVKVREPVIALEPADTAQPLALSPMTVTPIAAAPVQQRVASASPPVLPKTASRSPWIAAAGFLLLALATYLRAWLLWGRRYYRLPGHRGLPAALPQRAGVPREVVPSR